MLASVQALIEKPFPYILARCSDVESQLMYGPIRKDDINEWHDTEYMHKGIIYRDSIRFFKGMFFVGKSTIFTFT